MEQFADYMTRRDFSVSTIHGEQTAEERKRVMKVCTWERRLKQFSYGKQSYLDLLWGRGEQMDFSWDCSGFDIPKLLTLVPVELIASNAKTFVTPLLHFLAMY